jgi:hypothetical protein
MADKTVTVDNLETGKYLVAYKVWSDLRHHAASTVDDELELFVRCRKAVFTGSAGG